MVTAKIFNGYTFFKKKMPDHRIVVTVTPNNITKLCAIPNDENARSTMIQKRHETRAHALCYAANALNLPARI
jgi:hypothetical protein